MRATLSNASVSTDSLLSAGLATRPWRVSAILALGLAGWLASAPSHALVELTGITKIAGGSSHTCALTTAGGVKCWGANESGQIGDNSTMDRLTPVAVSGLTSGVAAVAAGSSHTCALTTGGGVKCWGSNAFGQLGDNTTSQRLTPIDVSGLASGVAAITAGFGYTCALTTAGIVKCWGYNAFGQLGNNTTAPRSTPVDVSGLPSGVAAITAGWGHTCALTTAGIVKCWGSNAFGQLGDNTTFVRLTPVDVSGLASGVAAIAAGTDHTCALSTAGGVKCWGRNDLGALGDNTTSQRLTPVDVSGLTSGVAAITAGGVHTCALTTGGGVKCWGDNLHGQLGINTILFNHTRFRLTPVDVSGLASGVVAITAGSGSDHTCALSTAGGVKCWGDNTSGQLGDNSTSRRLTPVDVSGLASGVAAIASGSVHTCAITTAGGVKCWGYNDTGELGDNTTFERLTPVAVSGLASGMAAVTAGSFHTCTLTTGGGAKCWGNNAYGQLGDNTTSQRLTPVDVSGLASDVLAITTGFGHTCMLTTAGGARCWGSNTYGQLGDNTASRRLTPVDVSGLASGVLAITAGFGHTCALTTGGGVKCWGYNNFGQLGDNTIITRRIPVDVLVLASGVVSITAGTNHTCALTTAGIVKCWGNNTLGQLGDNTTAQRQTPVNVSGLTSEVAAVTAGTNHTCALTTAGGVKCWGNNTLGQLGDNTTAQHLTPVDVSGLASGVAAIAAGDDHTCVITTGGGAKCWGDNTWGQLGDGTAGIRPFPMPVLAPNPPVIEFYNAILDHYFLTANAGEAAAIDNGSAGPSWSRTGNTFQSGGNTAVCRFYGSQSPGPNSHFYTADAGECAFLKSLQASTPASQPRWNFESNDFGTTPSINGACAAGLVPVYRAYNRGSTRGIDSNHRITSSQAAIQEVVNRGWNSEGAVMCAPT